MTSLSVLQNFRASMVRAEPFPHFVIDGALPSSVYDELARSYPPVETIFQCAFRKNEAVMAQNARYDLSAAEVYRTPELPLGVWREFVHYHTSQEFLDELLEKLGDTIHRIYPELLAKLHGKAPKGTPRAGVRRHSDGVSQCEVALDCQIGMNSPVEVEGTSVIGPHIDNPKELYAGLFYLRDREDRSAGGDLVLYDYGRNDFESIRFFEKRYIDPALVRPRGTIRYEANRFVWLLNTLRSIHGVTVRQPGPLPRRLCNIIAEVYPTTGGLFDLSGLQPRRTILGRVPSLIRRLRR